MNKPIDGAGFDVAGPISESAHTRPAFVERAFPVTVRSVVARNFHFRHVGHNAGEHRVPRTAVIAVKKDQRVIAQPFVVERGHDAADLIVEAGDHARIDTARWIFNVGIAINIPSAPDTVCAEH
jgi:hypothetical protein